jgi:type IV fimbrial biogenesis protein FimT
MSGRRGFTLLELMIVVVIISILTILTLPSMKDTLSEGRLYGSARSVVDVLTFARMQAIMRHQAHEVTFTLSPDKAGGKVEVTRHAANRCNNVLPGVVRQASLDPEVALTQVLDATRAVSNITRVCFRVDGRAADAATGNLLMGELNFELVRFDGPEAGAAQIGWSLYTRLSNMGVASLVKVFTAQQAAGAGG